MDSYTVLMNHIKNFTEESCIKCIEYCYDKLPDFSDKNLIKLFEISVRYLISCKVGHWNKDDAKLVINYFSNLCAHKYGINSNVKISILNKDEYVKLFGKSDAICVCKRNMYEIFYSHNVINNLISNDLELFLCGMQSIFHEVIHVVQNSIIKSDSKEFILPKLEMYVMTIESIVMKADSDFYRKNYTKLYKENHAQKVAFKETIDTIKKYNYKLYDNYKIEQLNLYEYSSYFETSNMTEMYLKKMDPIACLYIKNNPQIIDEYPLLKLVYNEDGLRKNILQLIKDRKEKIVNYEDINKLNDLYYLLCNGKNFIGDGLECIKEEILMLIEYLSKNEFDEFEIDLLKYRLNNEYVTKKQMDTIINYVVKSNPNYSCYCKIKK